MEAQRAQSFFEYPFRQTERPSGFWKPGRSHHTLSQKGCFGKTPQHYSWYCHSACPACFISGNRFFVKNPSLFGHGGVGERIPSFKAMASLLSLAENQPCFKNPEGLATSYRRRDASEKHLNITVGIVILPVPHV
jgi:hypothetical protein